MVRSERRGQQQGPRREFLPLHKAARERILGGRPRFRGIRKNSLTAASSGRGFCRHAIQEMPIKP
jgi:hypothetical protein